MSFLIFLAILAGMVVLAFVVSRVTGARAYYIEDWKPEAGERVLFEDRRSDTYVVPTLGQARFTSYARTRRGFVLVTNRRILAGQKVLFVRKSMIQYEIHVGHSTSEDAQSLGGGLLTRGYQTLVVEPTIERTTEGRKPFVELTPSPTARSSLNLQAIRIYTDRAADFPLPDLHARPGAELASPA